MTLSAASASPLAGLRVALDIVQDHPHPILATLLKEELLREDATVGDPNADVTISGSLVCNGYADVYFTAELRCAVGDETLFALRERPAHGDRQENLAREVVARLRAEWPKRERRSALRELGGP